MRTITNKSELFDNEIALVVRWYSENKEHVDRLRSLEDRSYPPSGSDIKKPELWKPPMWRWFLDSGLAKEV